ncbi:MAG: hypothetical protein AAF624_02465 [Bacteroidota bacterium]
MSSFVEPPALDPGGPPPLVAFRGYLPPMPLHALDLTQERLAGIAQAKQFRRCECEQRRPVAEHTPEGRQHVRASRTRQLTQG